MGTLKTTGLIGLKPTEALSLKLQDLIVEMMQKIPDMDVPTPFPRRETPTHPIDRLMSTLWGKSYPDPKASDWVPLNDDLGEENGRLHGF